MVRRRRTVAGVLHAYVLRLLPDALELGQVVGFLEEVETGTRRSFRSLEDLGQLLCRPDAAPVAPQGVTTL